MFGRHLHSPSCNEESLTLDVFQLAIHRCCQSGCQPRPTNSQPFELSETLIAASNSLQIVSSRLCERRVPYCTDSRGAGSGYDLISFSSIQLTGLRRLAPISLLPPAILRASIPLYSKLIDLFSWLHLTTPRRCYSVRLTDRAAVISGPTRVSVARLVCPTFLSASGAPRRALWDQPLLLSVPPPLREPPPMDERRRPLAMPPRPSPSQLRQHRRDRATARKAPPAFIRPNPPFAISNSAPRTSERAPLPRRRWHSRPRLRL